KVPASVAASAALVVPDLAADFFSGVVRPPVTTSLRVSVPVLVIWGMRDPVLLPHQLDELGDYAPHLTVLRLADAGHYPMRSHAPQVNEAIRAFMGGVR